MSPRDELARIFNLYDRGIISHYETFCQILDLSFGRFISLSDIEDYVHLPFDWDCVRSVLSN